MSPDDIFDLIIDYKYDDIKDELRQKFDNDELPIKYINENMCCVDNKYKKEYENGYGYNIFCEMEPKVMDFNTGCVCHRNGVVILFPSNVKLFSKFKELMTLTAKEPEWHVKECGCT